MAWSYTASALVVLAALLAAKSVRDYFRLRHIRGPWLAGWSNLWMLWALSSGRMNLILADVNKKYGAYRQQKASSPCLC